MTTDPTDNLLTLSAAALARRIRAKQLTPTEAVEAHIQRIMAVNPRINALVTPLFEGARAQAAAQTEHLVSADPDSLPPLFGVPVTIKDALAVAGARFTAGSWFMRDNIASHDAEAVKRLKDAGAVILGKTNCPDMSWVAETENPVFGLTRNPHNLRRTAGGSSGGEGALIAAGGSPLGLGSDIAGSIRLPAGLCGAVGLKPSANRISTAGHVPEAPASLPGWNTVGPLARRVEDLALALGVLSETPVRSYREITLAGRRVTVFMANPWLYVSDAVSETVMMAAGALQAAGMDVVRTDGLPAWGLTLAYLASLQREGEQGMSLALGGGEPLQPLAEIRNNLRGEKRLSYKALWMAVEVALLGRLLRLLGFGRPARLAAYRAQVRQAAGDGGVILCPVHQYPALPHGYAFTPFGAPLYTLIFNALGMPSVAVPVQWTRRRLPVLMPGGLPLSVQVVAQPGEDETALAVAAELERVFGGWRLAAA